MSKKPKFKPVITRVKLNPEQAVLTCNCFNTRNFYTNHNSEGLLEVCSAPHGFGRVNSYYTSCARDNGNATS